MRQKSDFKRVGKGKYIMETDSSRDAIGRTGKFLYDLAEISDKVILPNAGPAMSIFVADVYMGALGEEPVELYTPVCPDWSRNFRGEYDFKSLGKDASFIAGKFLQSSLPLLKLFKKHGIAYRGTLIFADWGSETEITASDTYGDELAPDEVVRRFAEGFEATNELLLNAQSGTGGDLFEPYKLVSMTEFLVARLGDPGAVCEAYQQSFVSEPHGVKLLEYHHKQSLPFNKRRLGLGEVENKQTSLVTLSEYATLGEGVSSGVMVAAESMIASRAYTVFRPRKEPLPIVFLKGERKEHRGVNIL